MYSACTFDTVNLPGTVQEVTEAGYNNYSASKDVAITYADQLYDVCAGDSATVTFNGNHNIQEVTEAGYNNYSASEHIGSPIHGFENKGHVQSFSMLGALPGETRYFVCTLHPKSKFATCSKLKF